MKSIKSSSKKAESLIELIIVLFLLSIIMLEASAMLKNFIGFTKTYEKTLNQEDDVNLFFSFIENDFKLYNSISVKSDSIYFDNKNNKKLKTCEYFLKDGRIKRVAGSDMTGNTYFLKGIEDLKFLYEKENNFIVMELKIKDKRYKKILSCKDIEVIEWRKQVQV